MDETRLLSVLNRMNTWWDGNDVPQSLRKAAHRRRDFYWTIDAVTTGSRRQVWTIRGPRQVGKTTLCGQLIEAFIEEEDISPHRILYISIENSQIQSDPENIIRDSIEVYEQYVLQQSLRAVDGILYVFIDEIQKADGWAETLKYYTDTYENIQFITTGSVSTLIKQDASETLVGRLKEQIMMPMKFVDYIRYHGTLSDEALSESLRSSLHSSLRQNDTSPLTTALTGFYGKHHDAVPRLTARKDEYLLKGGYPGVIDFDPVDAYADLDTDLRYTVTGDLASVFSVHKPEKLLTLLSLIVDSTGGTVNVRRMAKAADLSRQTVEQYLEYLEEFFLITPVPRHTTSEYRSRGQPKLYIQDVGVYNTLAGTLAESTLNNPDAMGPLLETVVCDHAKRLQFNLSGTQNTDVGYWNHHGEVDFVIDGPEYTLPIEVKHGDSTKKGLRGLRRFITDQDLPFGIALNDAGQLKAEPVSNSVNETTIVHIPVWLFLLIC